MTSPAATARPSSFITSDPVKFVLAWAAFLALVIVCFGLAGVTSGPGFAAGAGAAALGLAVTGSFVAGAAYVGNLVDRMLGFDAVFRSVGGLVGLIGAAVYGVYLYGQYVPPASSLMGGP
jgi:hypothetical protein